jgi:triacylglycerol esterase/lipase EstA (alpha/beta hydrolase family)
MAVSSFFFFLFFLPFSPGKHEDEGDLRIGKDLTADFRELVEQARGEDFSALPEYASDFVFLLIPGLFTQHYGKGYMKDIIEQFQALNLDVRKMELNTDLPVVENAKFINAEIKELTKAGKTIVALGHSKGGVDFATAVGKFHLYKKIHAFVAIQTPWGGTPFAEAADSGGIIETLHNIANRIFKADKVELFFFGSWF